MTIKVNIDLDREFVVNADVDTVFAFLSNVPESASHFPKVDELEDLGGGTFRWNMEKVGIGDHAIQTIYASTYESDDDAKTITWTPVKGEGNALVSGGWKITEASGGTKVSFESSAELSLPLPGLLKLAISPVVKHEFTSMVDTYMESIQEVLN